MSNGNGFVVYAGKNMYAALCCAGEKYCSLTGGLFLTEAMTL